MTRTPDEFQNQIDEEITFHLETIDRARKLLDAITRPTYTGFEDSKTLQRLSLEAAGLSGSLNFRLSTLQESKRLEDKQRSLLEDDDPDFHLPSWVTVL